jgi:hypothetical protein
LTAGIQPYQDASQAGRPGKDRRTTDDLLVRLAIVETTVPSSEDAIDSAMCGAA